MKISMKRGGASRIENIKASIFRITLIGLGALGCVFSPVAKAGVVSKKSSLVVLSETTHELEVKLDTSTVICSTLGYSELLLKVQIPELADITLMDHRNPGAEAPCISSGRCDPWGVVPPEMIDPAKPTERVKVVVTYSKEAIPNLTENRCDVSLYEDIRANIRGHDFGHRRVISAGYRSLPDCR